MSINLIGIQKDFDHGPVPLPEANKRFHACCEKEFTAPEEKNCIPLCKYDITNAEVNPFLIT